MATTAASFTVEAPRVSFGEGDAAWLVRQFGRYASLLRGGTSNGGRYQPFMEVLDALSGTGTVLTQDQTQTRNFLQLSNRQHQEHLQNMQQLSLAHERRQRSSSARGEKRKRARGCENGAESSSSSSSEGEAVDDAIGVSRSALSHRVTERDCHSARGSRTGSASEAFASLKDKAIPLLLSAYDMATCTSGSSSSAPAALPRSLIGFISSREHKEHGLALWSHKIPRAYDNVEGNAVVNTRRTAKHFDLAGEPGEEKCAGQEALDGGRLSEADEADLHPIRQLQERVLSLPRQNQATKERLMREQLRLLAVRWKCLLLSGWNILVAGCGSKGCLLRNFGSVALNDGFCCMMNAYQREFKLQHALQAVVQVIRTHLRSHSKYTAAASATIMDAQAAGGASASCKRLVKELKALLRQCSHFLYLVVLGLDSLALTDARRHLSALASCDRVRLICSADHLQHALLVDAAELRDFRFVFETSHTRRDYRDEVLSRWGSMCGFVPGWLWTASQVHSAGASNSSVNFAVVLRGLTTNHKRLLRSIAELQLAQLERNESPIVGLAELGTETSGVALSLSKLKLKELLVEVTSHGAAVHARKNGQDAVAIRANKTQLQELLQLLDKAGV